MLKNESCFEFMPSVKSGSVDLIIIDPPYNISKESGFKNGGIDKLKITTDFGKWDHDFSGLDSIINESYRVLKNGGTFICFYDLWKITELKKQIEEAKFKQLRMIEWIKINPVPINSRINYLTNTRR
jgi:DNA modification methylase